MTPWYQCALDKNCIAPPGPSRDNHWQDQAPLTFLVHRVAINVLGLPLSLCGPSPLAKISAAILLFNSWGWMISYFHPLQLISASLSQSKQTTTLRNSPFLLNRFTKVAENWQLWTRSSSGMEISDRRNVSWTHCFEISLSSFLSMPF
jgi:hypothetical protein